MIVIKYIFWLIYRIWFYILVVIPIIVLLPLLLISILKEDWYPFFFKLERIWARFIIVGMGFRINVEREQVIEPGKSYMFIANHTSMIDIMLMIAVAKNPFVFVGKAELAKMPFVGFFYKRTSILVDRSSPESRQAVFLSAQRRLSKGLSICIFPEGLVPEESVTLADFKDGAFRLAIKHQIPIVPITFGDNKKRFSYTFFSGSPGRLRVRVHKFLETKEMDIDETRALNTESRTIISKQLSKFNPN